MKNRQPYPFFAAKSLDYYLDALLNAYNNDIESINNRVETLLNVVGNIPEIASGVAESIVLSSSVFAETGKTILLVAFENAERFVSEIPDAAGKTAFFVSSVLEKPLAVAEDITIEDVWEWIKAINSINLLSPEFIPDNIRDENPARILRIPNDSTIDYEYSNVTDIDRTDIDKMLPDSRLYPGNVIDFSPYGIAGKALITCVHTQYQESVQMSPDYYHFDESLWDLSDVQELVPFRSPFAPVSPLNDDIKDVGVKTYWIDYARREMVIQDGIRVFKRETVQENGNRFSQAFLQWEKRLYTPSSVRFTADFKPEESGSHDTSSVTIEENTIERTSGLLCHGVFLPDRFGSVCKPKKAAFPFLPLIFTGVLMFYPYAVNGVLSTIAGLLTTIRTNEGKENE